MNQARTRILQAANVAFYIAMVIVNIMAVTRPLNGVSTGEVAWRYPHLFLPASWTFGIWSVIYLLLLLFVIYQSAAIRRVGPHVLDPELAPEDAAIPQPTDRAAINRPAQWVNKLDILFVLTCALNIAWLYAWHHFQYTLSTGIIFVYLLCLIIIYVRIQHMPHTIRIQDRWFVAIPFSVYLGWISVASISNTATLLRSSGWDGLGLSQDVWGIICIVLAVALACFFRFRFHDRAYAVTIAWGLAGISMHNFRDQDDITSGSVAIAALLGSIVCVLLLFVHTSVRPVTIPKHTQGRAPTAAR